MADGLGLNAESVKRVVKSKWFLPALGIGGVIVVLLIVSQRGGGGASSSDGTTDYPGEIYDPNAEAPITGAPDTAGLEGMINDLFGEYAGAINSQIQQQNQAQTDYLTAQVEAQQSYLESFAGNVEDAISNIQSPAYYDPYAGYTPDASAGYDYSGYGSDFIQTEPAYAESAISTYEAPIVTNPPPAPVERTGQSDRAAADLAPVRREGQSDVTAVQQQKTEYTTQVEASKAQQAAARAAAPPIIRTPAPAPAPAQPRTGQAAPKPAPVQKAPPAPVQRTGQAAPKPAPAPKPPVPKQQRGGRTITK